MVGGAEVARNFINAGLATEIRMMIVPIILGEGKLFMDQIGSEHKLHLLDAGAYKNGFVELHYALK